jgi:hypothetical protein
MTTGAELRDLLGAVVGSEASGFDVVDVASAPGFKIGHDAEHAVILLTPPDSSPEPPTQLHRISLDPRIALKVRDVDGTVHEGEYGLLRLRVGQAEYFDAFLHVVANLVEVIGPDPAPGEVSVAMRRLVRLFDPPPNPRGSVLGLWGELIVLSSASDAALLLDAWHSDVDARFDFAAQGSRLEVKATTGPERRHHFSLEQLVPVTGTTTVIASIMTTETLAGTTLRELIGDIEEVFISDPSRQMRIHEVVAETLGPEWARSIERAFDAKQALESLTLLPAQDVPRVGEVPSQVTGVTFVVDCSAVDGELHPNGLAQLIVSQAE